MSAAEKMIAAADALDRLAREQNAAAARAQYRTSAPVHFVDALNVSRGEAVCASEVLRATLPEGLDRETAATQHAELALSAMGARKIPSATLRAWAAGWRSLAAERSGEAEKGSEPPPLSPCERALCDHYAARGDLSPDALRLAARLGYAVDATAALVDPAHAEALARAVAGQSPTTSIANDAAASTSRHARNA